MKIRTSSINDPHFNEFVYHCIVSSGSDARNKLPVKYLKYLHSRKSIKSFCVTALFEEKIEVLSWLGIEFAMFFARPEQLDETYLKEAYEFLDNENKGVDSDVSQKLIKNKQFVITNRTLMMGLAILGQHTHHNTFMINREYALIADEIRNFGSADKAKGKNDEMMDALIDNKLLAKFVLDVHASKGMKDILRDYNEADLCALIYLYLRSSGTTTLFIDERDIYDYFRYTGFNIGRFMPALIKLRKQNDVNRVGRYKDWKFAITASGIQTVNTYVGKFVTSASSNIRISQNDTAQKI